MSPAVPTVPGLDSSTDRDNASSLMTVVYPSQTIDDQDFSSVTEQELEPYYSHIKVYEMAEKYEIDMLRSLGTEKMGSALDSAPPRTCVVAWLLDHAYEDTRGLGYVDVGNAINRKMSYASG